MHLGIIDAANIGGYDFPIHKSHLIAAHETR